MEIKKNGIEAVCCYSSADRDLLHLLKKHLSPLQREGLLTLWTDMDIDPGTEWDQEIRRHLDVAQMILLLISADFIASNYCWTKEMQRALKRHERRRARVIPIIARPVSWQHYKPLSKLQALPERALPITDWPNLDRAFLSICEGIRQVIKGMEVGEGKRAGGEGKSPVGGFFGRNFDPSASELPIVNEPVFEEVAPIDNSLPDDEWLAYSETRFRQMVENYYGSCERVGQGGKDRYGHQDFGTALFFYQKSIDMLHSHYLFGQMINRQPSPADTWLVDGYTSSLGASLALHPTAPVDNSVREATHRLLSIAAACERVGLPSQLYRGALNLMAVYAPHVKLDDILWI